MPSWPSTLQLDFENYGFEVNPDTFISKMASNRTRQRRRMKNRNDIFNIQLTVDATQLATFTTFFETTLNQGVDSFTANYYPYQIAQSGTFYIKDAEYTRVELASDLWRINMKWIIINRSMTYAQIVYDSVNTNGGF